MNNFNKLVGMPVTQCRCDAAFLIGPVQHSTYAAVYTPIKIQRHYVTASPITNRTGRFPANPKENQNESRW